MWRKTLGLAVLALMLFALSACTARYPRSVLAPVLGSGHGRYTRPPAYRYRPYRFSRALLSPPAFPRVRASLVMVRASFVPMVAHTRGRGARGAWAAPFCRRASRQ